VTDNTGRDLNSAMYSYINGLGYHTWLLVATAELDVCMINGPGLNERSSRLQADVQCMQSSIYPGGGRGVWAHALGISCECGIFCGHKSLLLIQQTKQERNCIC
jgi:hypothetical protein